MKLIGKIFTIFKAGNPIANTKMLEKGFDDFIIQPPDLPHWGARRFGLNEINGKFLNVNFTKIMGLLPCDTLIILLSKMSQFVAKCHNTEFAAVNI